MTVDKMLEVSIFPAFENCCDNPDIIEYEGNYICQNCGLVHGPVILMNEKRIFTPSDVETRKQNEPVTKVGARTMILNKGIKDSNGTVLDAKKRMKFAKLSKINNSYSTTYERNLTIATPKLKNFCAKLGLPNSIVDETLYYYSKAVKKRLTMGKSIECLICACIYLTTRLRKLPRSLEEISNICEISVKSIRRTYRMLLKYLEIPNLKPIDHSQYIARYGEELGISLEIQKRAIEIIENAKSDPDIKVLGKDPKGFAAAALYIACKEAKKSKSQALLSQVAHVSEVTLRYRIRNLKKQN
ncbi:MAG: transcription initiation factor IIB [Candidatus Helarchaeota archaeon]